MTLKKIQKSLNVNLKRATLVGTEKMSTRKKIKGVAFISKK